MQTIIIGHRSSARALPFIIIAECGVHHCGRLDLAMQMIDRAKEAGADCVKFQTIYPERTISRPAPKADYQIRATGSDESQLDMIRKLQLPDSDFVKLKAHCDVLGIMFLSTPFDETAADFLAITVVCSNISQTPPILMVWVFRFC